MRDALSDLKKKLVLDKGGISDHCGERLDFLMKCCWDKWIAMWKKIKSIPYFIYRIKH